MTAATGPGLMATAAILVGASEARTPGTEQTQTIVSQGRSAYTIVVPAKAEAPETWAAQQLQQYLHQITGVKLPIRKDDVIKTETVISVGQTRWVAPEKLAIEPRYTHDDTYRMTVRGPRLFLVGACARGTVYAVFHWLERLGCRWYAIAFYYEGHHEVVPNRAQLSLDPLDRIERPVWPYRVADMTGGRREVLDWAVKNRKNVIRYNLQFYLRGPKGRPDYPRKVVVPAIRQRGLLLQLGDHDWRPFLPAETYAKDHPEWFGMLRGKRLPWTNRLRLSFCTSNPDARRELVANVVATLKKLPEADQFGLWPQDSQRWCECPACKKLGPPRQFAIVLKEAAEALARERPGMPVEFIAYERLLDPPAGTDLPANTLMDLCPVSRCYRHAIFDPSCKVNAAYVTALRKWKAFRGYKGALHLYSYYRKFAWRSMPLVMPQRYQDEIRYYHRELGVRGLSVYDLFTPQWRAYELISYILAKLSWDPMREVRPIVQDWCRHRFGRGADAIERYVYQRERTLRLLHNEHYLGFTLARLAKNPPGINQRVLKQLGEAQALLDQAKAAAGEDAEARWHLDILQATHDYASVRTRAALALQSGTHAEQVQAVEALIATANEPRVARVLHAPAHTIVREAQDHLKRLRAKQHDDAPGASRRWTPTRDGV